MSRARKRTNLITTRNRKKFQQGKLMHRKFGWRTKCNLHSLVVPLSRTSLFISKQYQIQTQARITRACVLEINQK